METFWWNWIRKHRAKKLLKTSKLNQTMDSAYFFPIDISPHYSLNTKKEVIIRYPNIKDCTDDEILEGLKA